MITAPRDTWRGGRRPHADDAERAARERRAVGFNDGVADQIVWPWQRLKPLRHPNGRFTRREA